MYAVTNLYFGKAVDVDRVLLVRYPENLNLRKLASESSVSLGEAFKVSKALINERMALRESNRSELKLMAPSELLERLAKVNNFLSNTKFIEYYTQEEDISKFLEKLKGLRTPEYAITGLAGALLVAPFVRPTNVHIYVKSEDDARKLADKLDLMPVESNGNVKFAIAKSNGIFYGSWEVNGINVVSNIQLYMDLLNYPARGAEAANEVHKMIEKNWNRENKP
jgi:hypothetical protein